VDWNLPGGHISSSHAPKTVGSAAAAKSFVKDMRAFHAAATGFERDEIAAPQLLALREHLRPGEKLRLTDVHELFLAMKDQS
jgi:hypothetical protein